MGSCWNAGLWRGWEQAMWGQGKVQAVVWDGSCVWRGWEQTVQGLGKVQVVVWDGSCIWVMLECKSVTGMGTNPHVSPTYPHTILHTLSA